MYGVEQATKDGEGERLQDYHMQLMLLEQQNKKRLMMARQKQEDQSPSVKQEQEMPKPSPNSHVQTPNHVIQECRIFGPSPAELKEMERLLKIRQEQDAMPIPRKQEDRTSNHVIQDCIIPGETPAEKQYKERLRKARREQEAMMNPPSEHVQAPQMAKQDLCIQAAESFLAEQQNKEPPQKAGRDAMPTPPIQHAKASSQKQQDHTLQDQQMHLMLLEQQNKKRLMMIRQEQDAMTALPKQEASTPNQAEPDYQRQLRLLEQENKKRLMMARQEQDAVNGRPKPTENLYNRLGQEQRPVEEQPKPVVDAGSLSEEEYQTALKQLEEAGRKRFQQVREQSANWVIPNQQGIISKMDGQVTALERYNKKRLALARLEHYGSPLPTEQRTKLLAKWEADYQRQVQDAAKPAEERTQQDKPLDNWEIEYSRELHEASHPTQASSPPQPPQFVDWEAQARAHIGVGPTDALSPESQKKVDDIIKQKYQQVWGTTDKEDNGQKALDPPVIQTYQEQLRAQKMTQQLKFTPQQKHLLQQQIQRLQHAHLAKNTGPCVYRGPDAPTIEDRSAAEQVSNIPTQRQFPSPEINSVRNDPSEKMLNATDDQIKTFLNKQQTMMNTAPQQIPLVQNSASGREGIPRNTTTTKPVQDEPSIEEQAAARFPNNTAAREDYEIQLKMLKQQNALRQQRMASAMAQQQNIMVQQHNAIKQHHQHTQALQSQQAGSSQGSSPLQNVESQMKFLEHCNKKRLLMAEQEKQSKKRMMIAKDFEQPAVAQPEKQSANATSTESGASGNCCWCGVKMARPSCCAANNSGNTVKRVSDYPEQSRGHALQDYQTQLMQLEQNRIRGGLPSAAPPTQETLKLLQVLTTEEKAQLAVLAQQPNNAQCQQQRKQIEMKALQRQAQAQLMQNGISLSLPMHTPVNQEMLTMAKKWDSAAELTAAQGQQFRAAHEQAQAAQDQARAQARHLQQQQQHRFMQQQAQQAAQQQVSGNSTSYIGTNANTDQQNGTTQKLDSAAKTEGEAVDTFEIRQKLKDDNQEWMLDGLVDFPYSFASKITCPYGLEVTQHPPNPNQIVLASHYEHCPYGLARWQHPGQQTTPASQQNPWVPNAWTAQPMASPSSYGPVYYVPQDPPPMPTPRMSREANYSRVNELQQYSQPLPAGPYTFVPIPKDDLTQTNESSPSATAATSPIKAEAKEEDIYSAPTEASEDSDWSRLSTPTEEDGFVVVEHGALPIRAARPEEQI
jgi:hypothetical protein